MGYETDIDALGDVTPLLSPLIGLAPDKRDVLFAYHRVARISISRRIL